MAEKTLIAWADSSLNLMMGCAGCELWNPAAGVRHCYAGTLTERHAGRKGWPESFDRPQLFPGRLEAALRWPDLTGTERPAKPWLNGLPRVVFLNDMGDPFTRGLPADWMAPHLPRLATSPHLWLLLTKSPARMAAFSQSHPLPPNVWPGTSVTGPATLARLDALRAVRGGGVRWASLEPLLAPVSLAGRLGDPLGFVIVGGESGPGYRPMEEAWALALRDECRAAGVPFFFKQAAAFRSESRIRLAGQVVREFPDAARHMPPPALFG